MKEPYQDDANKYLGIQEAFGIKDAISKEKIRKEFYKRIRQILGTEHNTTLGIACFALQIILLVATR